MYIQKRLFNYASVNNKRSKYTKKIISILIVFFLVSTFISSVASSQDNIKDNIKNRLSSVAKQKISVNKNENSQTEVRTLSSEISITRGMGILLKGLLETFPGLANFTFYMRLLDLFTHNLTVTTDPLDCKVDLEEEGVKTAVNGEIGFEYVIGGDQSIEVSRDGYITQTKTVNFDSDKSLSFTLIEDTGIIPPIVITDSYDILSSTSVKILGSLSNDGGEACDCSITLVGVDTIDLGKYNTGETFEHTFNNLQPGITYTCYATASNIASSEDGDPLTFDTTIDPPEVTTEGATSITSTSATLNGVLNGLGGDDSCEIWFEYGKTTDRPGGGSR